MTDNEIIKALECCQKVKGYRHTPICQECPLYESRCAIELPKNALNLINRQKEEIESLKIANEKMYDANKEQEAEIDRLNYLLQGYALEYGTVVDKERFLKNAKAEAVKEFAERLKKRETTAISCKRFEGVISTDDIDNLVKEFTEGKSDGDTMQT